MSHVRVLIEANAVPSTYEVFESLLQNHLAGDSSRLTELYAQAEEHTQLRQYIERYALEHEISVFYPHELKASPTHHVAFIGGSKLKDFKLAQFPDPVCKPTIIIVSDEGNAL